MSLVGKQKIPYVMATVCDHGGVQKYHHHWNVQSIKTTLFKKSME